MNKMISKLLVVMGLTVMTVSAVANNAFPSVNERYMNEVKDTQEGLVNPVYYARHAGSLSGFEEVLGSSLKLDEGNGPSVRCVTHGGTPFAGNAGKYIDEYNRLVDEMQKSDNTLAKELAEQMKEAFDEGAAKAKDCIESGRFTAMNQQCTNAMNYGGPLYRAYTGLAGSVETLFNDLEAGTTRISDEL